MSSSRTIEGINQIFERSEMDYTLEPIGEDFMQALFRAEDKKAGNPEFDPSLHDFNGDNSFWLGCRNSSGEIIATVAARLLDGDSFIETCRSYRLWYGDKIHFAEPLDIVLGRYDRVPSRRTAFIGAGWVRPSWRGLGISWALTRLANYVALERWDLDWLTGIAITGVAQAKVPTVNFGFTSSDLFADGFRVPGFSKQRLFLLTMTGQEASATAEADHRFLSCCPQLKLDAEFGAHLRGLRRRVEDDNAAPALIRAAG